jgi:phosphonate transport system ATP-binding protein
METPVRAEPIISVRDLAKRYDRVVALDGVSFDLEPGSATVLVGRSGAGKTTLLRCINGLERPTSGTVTVFGEDVDALDGAGLRRLRQRIGFVFQGFNLVGRATALENVLTGALGRIRGPRYGVMSYGAAMRREAMTHLERVGLADHAFQRADTLSGGQQQRVAIARMLFQKPDLVLADEPVASLDPETARQVLDLLVELCHEAGLTMLCSLHQLGLAQGWADRIIGLRDGRVVLDRPGSELTGSEAVEVYGNGTAGEEA